MIALEGQTITDISIQEFGSTEFIATLCKDNNVGLNDDLTGIDLIINIEPLEDENIRDYILLNKIKPNNKFDSDIEIINFIMENGDNAIIEDLDNQILE